MLSESNPRLTRASERLCWPLVFARSLLMQSLPKSIRSGAVATVYAVAISVFGGSGQFVVAWLLDVTQDPLAPAYLWLGAAAIGLTAMLLVKESAPLKLRQSDPKAGT